jgi:hypothetical protein
VRVNLIDKASGTTCAVDESLIIEVKDIVLEGLRANASENVTADVTLNVLEVANGNFRDGGNEWVEE